ncbi:MAG: DUF3187 family protein [Gemmatimonadetes bacterium]|nr:DUF3187 family protein [Gemmatimonadota bacterium]
MRRLAPIFLLTCLAGGTPLPLVGQLLPLGPLGTEEGSPLQRLGYTPMIEAPEPVEQGRLRTDVWMGYSNIFEQDSSTMAILYLDTERLLTALTVRYGLADQLEVGLRTTFETDWGGFLDGFIVGFHDALHLGTRNERNFPRGVYSETLQSADGRMLLDIPRNAVGPTDLRVFAKWGVVSGSRGTFSLRALTRIPTRRLTVGSERTDVAGMAMGWLSWRGWYLHGMAGGATVRRAADTRDVLRSRTWFGMLGAERPFREGLSGVVELTGQTQILRSFHDNDISGAPTNLIAGVVGRTKSGWRWELGMQEDLPPRGPSIDFTVQLALSRTW